MISKYFWLGFDLIAEISFVLILLIFVFPIVLFYSLIGFVYSKIVKGFYNVLVG